VPPRRVEHHLLAEDALQALQACNAYPFAPSELWGSPAPLGDDSPAEGVEPGPPPQAAAGSAEQVDERLMQLLLLLIARSHYSPFTQRDAAMASSLGSDYLWQLFILSTGSRLDSELALRYRSPATASEASGVLMMKRGYTSERQSGRLLLQKVDYLQLLVVQAAWNKAGEALEEAGRRLGLRARSPPQLAPGPQSAAGAAAGAASAAAAPRRGKRGSKRKPPGSGVTTFLAAVAQKGIAPALSGAADSLGATLSSVGLLPAQNVVPLEQLEQHWPVEEPERWGDERLATGPPSCPAARLLCPQARGGAGPGQLPASRAPRQGAPDEQRLHGLADLASLGVRQPAAR
jgi:hypothetical protein